VHEVCVKAPGLFEGLICLELRECVTIENLITRVLDLKGIKINLEALAVSEGSKTLKLSDDACSYKELTVFRLFHGG